MQTCVVLDWGLSGLLWTNSLVDLDSKATDVFALLAFVVVGYPFTRSDSLTYLLLLFFLLSSVVPVDLYI